MSGFPFSARPTWTAALKWPEVHSTGFWMLCNTAHAPSKPQTLSHPEQSSGIFSALICRPVHPTIQQSSRGEWIIGLYSTHTGKDPESGTGETGFRFLWLISLLVWECDPCLGLMRNAHWIQAAGACWGLWHVSEDRTTDRQAKMTRPCIMREDLRQLTDWHGWMSKRFFLPFVQHHVS